MSTTTQTKPQVIKFYSPQHIESSGLLSFTKKYLTVLANFKKYLVENSGKFVEMKFARLDENGFLKKIKKISGTIQNVQDDKFTFLSAYSLSGEYQSDSIIENVVRMDNPLGVIPIFRKIKLEEILKINKANHTDYDSFLKKVKNALIPCLGTERHIEIHTGSYLIDATILEINKSNILINQKRKCSHITTDRKYEFVDLRPQTYNLLFIEKNDYIKKVTIHNSDLYINPHDDED